MTVEERSGAGSAILLVARSDEARRRPADVLRTEGFAVWEAGLGEEALRLAADGPGLIVIETSLPDMTGFEVCRLLRSKPETAETPVLFLTETHLDLESALRGLQDGAYEYLEEPVDLALLIARARSLLGSRPAAPPRPEGDERFRQIIENMTDLIYRYRIVPPRGFDYVNPACTAITGYTPEEHYADPDLCFKILHPDDYPLIERLAPGSQYEGVPVIVRWVRKDATVIWMEQRFASIRDCSGNVIAVEGIARDITSSVRAVEELRLHREHLEELVDQRTAELRVANEALWREITVRRRAEEELTIKGRAVASAIHPLAIAGLEGNVSYVNRAVLDLWGYDEDKELLGRPVTDFWQPGERLWQVTQALRDTGAWRGELMAKRKDGSPLELQVEASVVRNSAGRSIALLGAFQDFTERNRAERARQRYAERLEGLNEIDRAILRLDSPEKIAQAAAVRAHRLVPCNRVSVALFDFETSEILVYASHGAMGELNPAGSRIPFGHFRPWIAALARGGLFVDERFSYLGQGEPLVQRMIEGGLYSLVSAPLMFQGKLTGALTLFGGMPSPFEPEHLDVAREIADSLATALQNARLFQSVSEQRVQLRELAAKLLDVEEFERRQLSRELHDRIGQNLAAIGINLTTARGQLSNGTVERVDSRLEESLRLIEETVVGVRGLMADLRPPVLDDYGLLAALRWYGQQFSALSGVALAVEGQDLIPRLPSEKEVALFRIAQEALTNVTKHAQAKHVDVTIEEAPEGSIRMTVSDDGVGFESGSQPLTRWPGWGLTTMRERVVALGGSIRIESTSGRGTTVLVEVPR